MDVCLMIEGQEGVTWEEWRALALTAEEHGFQALFRSDHYVGLMGDEERGSLDAWSTLTALAVETSRLRLGTMVSPVTFRHPSLLAKMATTADHVSAGRVELGMGAGWNRREHEAYGFDFPDTGTRMDLLAEQLVIVRGLLDEDRVSFTGRHYTLDDVRPRPTPVQERLPIIVGGLAGPRSAALAARFADEYNTVFPTLDEATRRREVVADAFAAADRDPDELRYSMMTGAIVGRDDDEVRDRGEQVMHIQGETGDVDAFLDAHRDQWIIGTVEQVVTRLSDYAARGIDRVMLQHLAHTDLDMVRLVGDEVIPEV